MQLLRHVLITPKIPALIVLVVLLVVQSACGWRLRGNIELPEDLKTARIQGLADTNAMYKNLASLLKNADVAVANDGEPAQLLLNLSELVETRRVASTNANTLVNQFQLTSSIEFGAENAAGEILLPLTTLTTTKNYSFDQNDVVGAAQEERILRREMQRELVQQIIRRLRFINSGEN